ncbi:MAG: response regulator [Deltaproteobacteria bacterium]|nr:response regulator [Deltaproteobacteria bacterium]
MVKRLRSQKFSIQKKLFLFQLALLLLVVVLVGTASVYLIVCHQKIVQQKHLALVSRDIVYHMRSELKSLATELQGIANSRPVQAYAESSRESILQRFMASHQNSFPLISYVDEYGVEEIRILRGKISDDYQSRYSHELIRRAWAVPGKVFIGSVAYSPDLEGPGVEMAIMPLEAHGDRFMGTIFAVIPLDLMADGICHECDENSFYIMIGTQGQMLGTSRIEFLQEHVIASDFKSADNDILKKSMALESGFARADIFGLNSFVFYEPLAELECSLLVGLPYREFMKVPWQLIKTVSLIFMLILVMGSLASYLVSKSITEPIKKLVEAVGLVAQGDFTRKVSIKSHDEIEELAEKFNLMTDDLDAFLRREKRFIEEKAEAATSLLKAKKMEAIGIMAGGVAHDLNNILAGITGYPELLLMKLPPESPLRKPLKSIQESGFRAAAVVADLLTVARGAATVKEPVSLNMIIENYLESAEFQKLYSLYPEVLVHAELEADLWPVKCSRIHIQKVIMNLVGNAVEAIDGSGSVIISTANQPPAADSPGAGRVMLKITDNGPGIAEADLEHIFEPFYSRKVMGRSGTGLGLTIVWNTVKDHAGEVSVESSSQGTIFTITLPKSEEKVVVRRPEMGLADLRGQGTVLVVDDEPQQLEIASQMLERLGYSVAVASSGEEALAYLQNYQVDLLLLDMIMKSGISGRQAYEEIVKLYPGQRAIVVSGFSVSEDVDRVISLGAGGFLRKPFTLQHLGAAVRKELHELRLVS